MIFKYFATMIQNFVSLGFVVISTNETQVNSN